MRANAYQVVSGQLVMPRIGNEALIGQDGR